MEPLVPRHLYPPRVYQVLGHALHDDIEEETRVLHEFVPEQEVLLGRVHKHVKRRREDGVQFEPDTVEYVL